MIELKYFAALRDQLGSDGEQLSAGDANTVARIRELLAERGGVWAEQLLDNRNLAAVNQQMANANTAVNDGDEVAFFPPVTGG
ncbi:MAG: molybdopterin converting factor subunit 1 [Porticoccaceae bacterium]|nr:molybdopterin converting factor subunit 1 [Porticoccaceae bacterium]